MDALVHGCVGLMLGIKCGDIAGCILFSVISDISFSMGRKEKPDRCYKVLHSIWPIAILYPFYPYYAEAMALHIIVDIVCHGNDFAPRLFYPLNYHFWSIGEWEYFNKAWTTGLILSLVIIGGIYLL